MEALGLLPHTMIGNVLPTHPKVAGVEELLHESMEPDCSNGVVFSTVSEHLLFDEVEDVGENLETTERSVVFNQELEMPGGGEGGG